ncbi:MAG: Uma2 family endonuclease [Myxococcota bacterium]
MSLRLLDETGRHRITERMLGILTEISSEELRLNVMGPAGRPLSRGLARGAKVLMAFLATELHEKVESLVCEMLEVTAHRDQPDAWSVRLSMPQLPADLMDEIFDALSRYRPPEVARSSWLSPLLLAAACVLLVIAWWRPSLPVEDTRWTNQIAQLKKQLAYSHQQVDRLSVYLEEADRKLELQRQELERREEDVSTSVVEAGPARPAAPSSEASDQPANEVVPPETQSEASSTRAAVRLSDATWTDFQTVRTIRGSSPSPRLGYARGSIEMVATAPSDVRAARMLNRLLSAYAVEADIDLRALGGWTLASETLELGVEPEEAFKLGPETQSTPDLVFEHAAPEQVERRLGQYASLGVPEVWLRVGERIQVYRLAAGGFERSSTSRVLPGLPVSALDGLLDRDDQTQATRDFVTELRLR